MCPSKAPGVVRFGLLQCVAGMYIKNFKYLFYIYIPWPFPPVWGLANNTKRQQKQWWFYSVLLNMYRVYFKVDLSLKITSRFFVVTPQFGALAKCNFFFFHTYTWYICRCYIYKFCIIYYCRNTFCQVTT